MSRLMTWHARCEALWKARKAKDPEQWAKELDDAQGPWDGSVSRADAAAHARKLGGFKAVRQLSKVEAGSIDEAAHRLYKETARKGGEARGKMYQERWDMWDNDSLDAPIQTDGLKHYSALWGEHFNRLSHAAPRKNPRSASGALIYSPARIVGLRNAQLKQKNLSPVVQDADWDVLQTAGNEALHAGAVSTRDANRFRVMTSAFQLARNEHRESESTRPFHPTYGALDTAALSVMRVGLQRMKSSGMPEASDRLLPVIESALSVHQAVPFLSARKVSRRQFQLDSYTYPGLHAVDTPSFHEQRKFLVQFTRPKAPGVSPEKPTRVPKSASPAAASSETSWPTSYADYRERRERGESFPTSTGFERHLAELRRQKLDKALTQAMSGRRLLTSWNQWRRGAA